MDSFGGFRRYCAVSLLGLGAIGLLGLAGCAKKGGSDSDADIAGVAVHHVSINESAGTMQFRITANPPLKFDTAIQYATLDPTVSGVVIADAVTDYTAVSNGSVTLKAGVKEAFFNIAITNDNLYERNEVFSVRITAPGDVNVGQAVAQGTIVNDDLAPAVSLGLPVNVTTAEVTEAAGVELLLDITVDGASSLPSEVLIKNAVGSQGAQAHFHVDYVLEWEGQQLLPIQGGGTDDLHLVFPASAQASRTGQLKVRVVDDGIVEAQERTQIALAKVDSDARVATGSIVEVVINDNDTDSRATARALNDTGVTSDSQAGIPAQQDSHFGRDYVAGAKAFGFTVYDANGQVISDPSTQTAHCVKDNASGLVWEVLLNDDTSFRSAKRTKYWYDPDMTRNGGTKGDAGYYDCAAGTPSPGNACSTSFYQADVNLLQLCGLTGWRLPTLEELRGLVDYQKVDNAMAGAFPDGELGEALSASDYSIVDVGLRGYWTADTVATSPSGAQAWYLHFSLNGNVIYPLEAKADKAGGDRADHYVRLVTEQTLP